MHGEVGVGVTINIWQCHDDVGVGSSLDCQKICKLSCFCVFCVSDVYDSLVSATLG